MPSTLHSREAPSSPSGLLIPVGDCRSSRRYRRECVIADLSAVGLYKYYYMILCTTAQLQHHSTPCHSDSLLPSCLFFQWIISYFKFMCRAVLYIFFFLCPDVAAAVLLCSFFLSCVYLRFRFPFAKTWTWGSSQGLLLSSSMKSWLATGPRAGGESSCRWGRICLTKINKYEFIAAFVRSLLYIFFYWVMFVSLATLIPNAVSGRAEEPHQRSNKQIREEKALLCVPPTTTLLFFPRFSFREDKQNTLSLKTMEEK